MGRGKGHHKGQSEVGVENDPELRTHMLFPGKQREDDDTLMGGYDRRGRSGSPNTFMKSVFGTGWGRRSTPGIVGQQQDPKYQITPESLDPFLRGAKQVSSRLRDILR